MKELKFRAKDKTTDEWIYSECLAEGIDGVVAFFNNIESLDLDTLGQFSRVKDQKGKDVYEDDIVLKDAVVLWKEGITGFGITTGKYGLANYKDREDFIIVGNIFDNSNLVKR